MWIVFAIAALVMLVLGAGGSYVVKNMRHMVPPEVFPHLPLIENVGIAVGLAMALFGVAMSLRRLKKYERRGLKRMRRSGGLKPPRRQREEREEDEEPEEPEELEELEPIGEEEDADATLKFESEPATKRLRRI